MTLSKDSCHPTNQQHPTQSQNSLYRIKCSTCKCGGNVARFQIRVPGLKACGTASSGIQTCNLPTSEFKYQADNQIMKLNNQMISNFECSLKLLSIQVTRQESKMTPNLMDLMDSVKPTFDPDLPLYISTVNSKQFPLLPSSPAFSVDPTSATVPEDPWCEGDTQPIWNGIDFSPCFHHRQGLPKFDLDDDLTKILLVDKDIGWDCASSIPFSFCVGPLRLYGIHLLQVVF